MRLIKTTTLVLEDFTGSNVPPYAILSHTWGTEEVSCRDMQNHVYRDARKLNQGYRKIKKSCEIAASDGFDYIWIDTCCIDKTSSSELSEAINSMYQWYRRAEVCYVYLPDVPSQDGADPRYVSFSNSRWFTRGWTLQELIAPPAVIFLDVDWIQIGTKVGLCEAIEDITGIQRRVLLKPTFKYKGISVAQKMSWAAKRRTTRVEDIAYCLMGIFGVNMPMLYGEGNRAFRRLQEEILKITDDQSIFAWASDGEEDEGGGLLASSPAGFINCGDIESIPAMNQGLSMPTIISNMGIHMEIPIRPSLREDTVVGVLRCAHLLRPNLGIFMTEDYRKKGHYRRVWSNELEQLTGDVVIEERKVIFAKAWNEPDPVDGPWSLLYLVKQTERLRILGILVSEVYPTVETGSYLAKTAAPGVAMGFQDFKRFGRYTYGDIVGGVRFIDSLERDSHGFDIVLKNTDDNLGLHITSLDDNETLRSVVESSRDTKWSRGWKEEIVDHLHYKIPGGNIMILVVCRRQFLNGERTYVVNVDLA